MRALAEDIGLRPAKRLGQNFVTDPNTVRRIVRTAGPGPDDYVVEVGPGFGSLTLGLLASGAHVAAIDVDARFARQLPETIARFAPEQAPRCASIQSDAVQLDRLPHEPAMQPTMLIANLPYNVAVPVLLHIWDTFATIRTGLVMVQSEVADRLVAAPGSRTYGAPSVKAAWYAELVHRGSVSRTVFWPSPNVDSALVSWTRRDPPAGEEVRRQVFALVDAAFAQRRKALRSALAPAYGSAAAAAGALEAAGYDPRQRGEQLSVNDFLAVAYEAPPSDR